MRSRPVIVGELTDNAKKFCLVAKMMLRWIISYNFLSFCQVQVNPDFSHIDFHSDLD